MVSRGGRVGFPWGVPGEVLVAEARAAGSQCGRWHSGNCPWRVAIRTINVPSVSDLRQPWSQPSLHVRNPQGSF